jgi:2-(3-amino-3-carboxypropyl)histidine synthase
MLQIDHERIYQEIERRKPRAVALSAPDALLPKTEEIAARIMERYGINAFVMGDACYGTCDTSDGEIGKLEADLAFNIGHTVSFEKLGKQTVLIDAFDDIKFDAVLENSLAILKQHKRIGLTTFSQHLHELAKAKGFYKRKGFEVIVGKGKGQLRNGQIFGCEFYPVYYTKDQVDVFLLLGQSNFHAIGVALSSNKPTYMLDPYSNEVIDVQQLANERLKKSILAVYKARDAERFGLIVGLRDGQAMLHQTLNLKKKLEDHDKKVELVALRDITSERLAQLRRVDAFIQTACPRISVDGYTFDRPVLSVPQAEALIRVLEGKDPGEFLVRANWL